MRQYIADILDNSDKKFLVFAHHIDVMKAIEQEVIKKRVKYIRIAGDVPSVLRGVSWRGRISLAGYRQCCNESLTSQVRVGSLTKLRSNQRNQMTRTCLTSLHTQLETPQTCCKLLILAAVSLWITSFGNQLATDLSSPSCRKPC